MSPRCSKKEPSLDGNALSNGPTSSLRLKCPPVMKNVDLVLVGLVGLAVGSSVDGSREGSGVGILIV